MSSALWIAAVVTAFGLAYAFNFTAATLSFGRELSTTGSPRGYQDAITPPWETRLGLFTYSMVLLVITASWYEFGAARGGLTVLAIFVALLVARRCIPPEDSAHYRILIKQSMVSRYADFVRDGDTCRADAMKELLDKAGIPVNLFHRDEGATSQPMTDAESVEIISAYGKAMLDRNSPYGELSALPYPKDRVKQALIRGIKETRDPKFREQLKGAYVMLSSWQVGGGSAELTPEELADAKKAMARALQGNFLEIPEKVAVEANALLAELTELGLS